MAARLRTHWGGPAQTLAALERALQSAVGQLQLEPLPAVPGAQPEGAAEAGRSERRQAAALLLLFMHALEQGVAAAATGSGASRAAAPQPAIAFLAANAKVRAWVGAWVSGWVESQSRALAPAAGDVLPPPLSRPIACRCARPGSRG